MSLLRPSKSLKLLSLLAVLQLSSPAAAQIASFFPEYLHDCINRCQPLWSANYDCTLSGQTGLDCLCQSSWVEQFYEGSTCTCTTDYESQEFRNWFDGTNGCSPYVEARIQSSRTARPNTSSSVATSTSIATTTSDDSSSSSQSSSSSTTRTTSAATTTTSEESTSAFPTTITTNGSTFTTMVTPTRTNEGANTTGPSIATTSPQDSGFITDQNKRWVIPTITIGGLIVVGAGIFAILFFCFGCCRRDGRGRYGRAGGPDGAAAGLVAKRKQKKMWLSSVPFFGAKSKDSDRSYSSQGMTLVGDNDGMMDTAYYGAGGYPGQGVNYTPYQHGAPLPPIDEVQSIAESTMTGHRDRGMPMPMDDEDEPFNFGYETQAVTPFSPVGSGNGGGLDRRESMMLPPAPVAQANMPLLGSGNGAGFQGVGLIGAAVTTSNNRGSMGHDQMTFSNRYEDLAGRRMERRMFDPAGNPMPMPMPMGMGMGSMVIPRKEIRSSPNTPIGDEPARSQTVSPPVSTVSSVSIHSSGFGAGGGSLAGRGTSSGRGDGGAFSGFPRAPAPAGSGQFGPRRGDYYEDYR